MMCLLTLLNTLWIILGTALFGLGVFITVAKESLPLIWTAFKINWTCYKRCEDGKLSYVYEKMKDFFNGWVFGTDCE